ncbi:hypothetical protein JCM6882_008538 [Rhodosporidiobolus microsporus]
MAKADRDVQKEADEVRGRLARMDEMAEGGDSGDEDELAGAQVQGNLGRMVFGPSGAGQSLAPKDDSIDTASKLSTTTKLSSVLIASPLIAAATASSSRPTPAPTAPSPTPPLPRSTNSIRSSPAPTRLGGGGGGRGSVCCAPGGGDGARGGGRRGRERRGDDDEETDAQRGKASVAFRQRALVKEVFANDDVVADFAEAKRQEIERDALREEDHTLPGWGSREAAKGAKEAARAQAAHTASSVLVKRSVSTRPVDKKVQ